ncbi:MAG: 16S rRNA (guanine(527)-N(7))-methyltransferase RsmG [Thermodesulfovibrionales bacterium]
MTRPEDLLRTGLAELGIPFGEDQVRLFLSCLAELKKWNKAHNLTSLRTDRDIIVKHFLDSLLFLGAVPAHAHSLADVGSGAGFPGVPITIMRPDLRVVLIEPTKKKAVFLRHVCHLLGLEGVEVRDQRLEEIEGLRVDVAVTRALFSVKDFMEKTQAILAAGGTLILSKGPDLDREMKDLDQSRISVSTQRLPLEQADRFLVVVRA